MMIETQSTGSASPTGLALNHSGEEIEMSRYIIEFANGDSPIAVDGYLNVEPTLRAKYGSRVEIGHNGDLPDGGERTMFWANKKDAANDDGVNALGEVRKAE